MLPMDSKTKDLNHREVESKDHMQHVFIEPCCVYFSNNLLDKQLYSFEEPSTSKNNVLKQEYLQKEECSGYEIQYPPHPNDEDPAVKAGIYSGLSIDTGKYVISIAWDVENRPAKNKDPAKVIEELRNIHGREAEVYVAIAENHAMFDFVSARLKHMEGVQVLPASSDRNAADMELKKVMDKFTKECSLPACAVFITDDLGCLNDTIKDLKVKGVKIILYSKRLPAAANQTEKKTHIQRKEKHESLQEMMKVVDEVVSFTEFLRNITDMPVEHWKVRNFPKQMTRQEVKFGLEFLYGGKLKLSNFSEHTVEVTIIYPKKPKSFSKAVHGKAFPNCDQPLSVEKVLNQPNV